MQSKAERLPESINNKDNLRVVNMLINHMRINFDSAQHRNDCINKFMEISYNQIIRPLVLKDREEGMSYGQLAMKYKVSYDTIRYILK